MSGFTVHTIESAPQKSKPLLETSKKSLGFVPNLYGVFAESPETLEAYQQVSALLRRPACQRSSKMWCG